MTEKSATKSGQSFGLAVKAVVRDDRGRCLVLRRSEANRTGHGVWELPGGKIEPGENFADALVREVKQECGLDVVPTRVIGALQTEMPGLHVVRLIMEVRVESGTVALCKEHDCYQWVPAAELGLPCLDCGLLKQKELDARYPWSVAWRTYVP